MGRPAVFLDRDGTIVREVDYLRSVDQLRLLRGAAEAIRRLNEAGFVVVLATNQSGIARGLLTESDLQAVHDELQRRLAQRGAHLDAIYHCPHHPEASVQAYRKRCRCRKPAPGLLQRAARELDVDLARSFAIGDSARDVEAGARAGCRTILVRTGYGRHTEQDFLGRCREALAHPAKVVAEALEHLVENADQEVSKLYADAIVDHLPAAADWILRQTKRPANSP